MIAAGGIADARGIAAAFALGATGVQIGTAFLACDESNASNAQRAALMSDRAHQTVLTNAFTGRLARSIPNRVSAAYASKDARPLPYPLQRHLVNALKEHAIGDATNDFGPMWAGQSARLLQSQNARKLFDHLVAATTDFYANC